MPFQTNTYTGLLHLDGPKSYLVTKDGIGNPVFTLMMLYNAPTAAFNWASVAAARNHFIQRGLIEGSPLRLSGFLTNEDVYQTGALQPVLHILQDLG